MSKAHAVPAAMLAEHVTAKRRFPRYSVYKPSAVAWLGEIPEHWNAVRTRYLCDVTTGGRDTQDAEDSGEFPFFVRSDTIERISTWSFDGEGVLTSGDGVGVGKIFHHYVGKMEIHQRVYLFHSFRHVIGRYFYYFLKENLFKVVLEGAAKSTVDSLRRPMLANFPIAFPCVDDQHGIVAFLDRETGKIDALVAKKERLIELLQEKRTALISHVVTKGLNPNAKMKESGIEWVGEVPQHWTVAALRHVARLQTGLTLGKKYAEDQILTSRPYLRVANVQDGYLDLDEITEVEIPPSDVSRYELEPGDVLMTEGGDFDKLGRGYVWENQIPNCLHQNHIFAVRLIRDRLHSHFLSTLLASLHGKNYFTSTSSQSTNLASTNSTKLKQFPVLLPSVEEQEAILEYVGHKTSQLEVLVSKAREGIDGLREYRTALISAAVTGKIDVREEA